MTTQNWPDSKRPGAPMFAERDGWHWLSIGDASPIPVEWNADQSPVAFDDWGWALGDYDDDLHSPEKAANSMQYHGPVLTPAQINEMLAAELERAAKAAQEVSDTYYEQRQEAESDNERIYADERMCAAEECVEAIRNLGAAP